jgi:hypothetical protein
VLLEYCGFVKAALISAPLGVAWPGSGKTAEISKAEVLRKVLSLICNPGIQAPSGSGGG